MHRAHSGMQHNNNYINHQHNNPRVCSHCGTPPKLSHHKWCDNCGAQLPPTLPPWRRQQHNPQHKSHPPHRDSSFSSRVVPPGEPLHSAPESSNYLGKSSSFEQIMHSQIKSMKSVDVGSSPYWFRNLWQNPKSRFLSDINFDDPPAWLIHLHDSTPLDRLHLIPSHIRLEFISDESENVDSTSDNIFSTLLASTNTTTTTTSSSLPPPGITIRQVLQQRAASTASPTTSRVSQSPLPPKPALMIPPPPTWSIEGNNAALDVFYTDFMSSFHPESPPSWFAWV